jgi:ribonuclease HII
VLVDGNATPRWQRPSKAIVNGDAKCRSIAAASIIAKVTRDRLMSALALDCPGYGFENHKGYAVPEHREALDRLGPSIHHRRFFAPVIAARLKHYPETVEATVERDLFTVDGEITSGISVTI